MINNAKSIFTSKMFWFNFLTTVAAILGIVIEQSWITPQISSILLMVVGIVNVFLRSITTQPVKLLLALAVVIPAMLLANAGTAIAQSTTPPKTNVVEVVEAKGDAFHGSVIRAAVELNKKGELKRTELVRLRVAMLSPAFREKAKQLAVVQMAASGNENVELSEDGTVNEAAIDWQGLTTFVEKLIPLIISLLNAFSAFSG